ncbi:MAG: cysteate synthase [Bacteroidales bacterium]|nr:cysteate synthase [Bacteroidales bacterium]
MKFKPTEYKLKNVATGRIFEDQGWTLADPEGGAPALVRAVYANKNFNPREDLDGLYRYADWMPVKRTLRRSHAPVTYHSKGLGKYLGLDNLYITFSGYNPKIGAGMPTCSFNETEAYSVCARLSKNEKRTLVVQSAGNTARAFAQVCSDNGIPIVICIPADSVHDMWFRKKLDDCVKVIAVPHGCDYFDAISLGEKLCQSPDYFAEGGAKNVARRDGMGTTVLSAVEQIGRIPDAYFQAVGSGTGAIAAWENALRLEEDGRFGKNKMKVFVAQNSPFTLIYDSWKSGSRQMVDMSPEQGRRAAEVILAKVLSNRKPPYGLAGGLFDTLTESGGDCFLASNDEIMQWLLRFRNLEGYDLLPAASAAVVALNKAVAEGKVGKEDVVMLNCTGGGTLQAMEKGYVLREPDIVFAPDTPAEEIIEAVNKL